jgi:hypothetical protein
MSGRGFVKVVAAGLVLAAALGQTGAPATAPAEAVRLEAKVVQVVSTLTAPQEQVQAWFPDHVRGFTGGLEVTVLLEGNVPLAGLRDEVVVSSAKDDQRRDIAEMRGSFARGDGGRPGTRVMTKDGRGVLVTVGSANVPAADAREVTIRGHVLLAGAGGGAVMAKEVPLRIGEVVHAGPVTLQVAMVSLQGERMTIGFRTAESAMVEGIEFLGPDGAVVPSTGGMEREVLAFPRDGSAEKLVSFSVVGGVRESVTLRVKLKTGGVEAPFEAKVRLGM